VPTEPAITIAQQKPAKIFNKQLPAIIFAKRRTAKLITRAKYDSNSIGTSKNAIANGAPEGKKRDKKFKP
jgi:hypothetical protein